MNKRQLAQEIATQMGISNAEAQKILKATTDVIVTNVKEGAPISIMGFGSFTIGHRAARTGRDPRTGAAIKIKAAKVIRFRPGRKLREAVAGGTTDTGPKVETK